MRLTGSLGRNIVRNQGRSSTIFTSKSFSVSSINEKASTLTRAARCISTIDSYARSNRLSSSSLVSSSTTSTSSLSRRSLSTLKTNYDGAAAERKQQGIVPKPLDADQTSQLVELLKNPPKGEEAFLVDLLTNRIPPGVDEAAYVKAAFLTAVAKGEAKSPLITPEAATKLLGSMQGGYNIVSLVELLDHPTLGAAAGAELCNMLLMFEAFFDVELKAKNGNKHAQKVMKSWADAEWFTSKPKVAEKITVTGMAWY